MRPPSSVCRNWRNPLFTGPSTFSLGTIASWNTSSRVSEARQPSLSSFLAATTPGHLGRSEEHTSELQSHHELVCRLLLEKKKDVKRAQDARETAECGARNQQKHES